MSEDQRQRQMDFILDQQAQIVANQRESGERIAKLESVVLRLANSTESRVADLDQRYTALTDAQIRTEDELRRLAEAQRHTDERLSALIDVVIQGRDTNGNGTQ